MNFEKKVNMNPTPEELSTKGHERKVNENPSYEEMLAKEQRKTARLIEILRQRGIEITKDELNDE